MAQNDHTWDMDMKIHLPQALSNYSWINQQSFENKQTNKQTKTCCSNTCTEIFIKGLSLAEYSTQ